MGLNPCLEAFVSHAKLPLQISIVTNNKFVHVNLFVARAARPFFRVENTGGPPVPLGTYRCWNDGDPRIMLAMRGQSPCVATSFNAASSRSPTSPPMRSSSILASISSGLRLLYRPKKLSPTVTPETSPRIRSQENCQRVVNTPASIQLSATSR